MSRPLIIFLALGLLMAHVDFSSGQVTFSRDWKPGKRNGDLQCGLTSRSPIAVCHMLLAELRQAIACDSRPMYRNLQTDEDMNQSSLYPARP